MVTVFTGILRAAETDEEFAAVIGHEIAHSVAHHAEATLSVHILCAAIMLPAAPFFLGAYIVPELFIVVAPISFVAGMALHALNRGDEAEAEKIGMLLMAEAGFNPGAAISFWKKMHNVEQQMLKTSGKKQIAEYQSTHPHVSPGSSNDVGSLR